MYQKIYEDFEKVFFLNQIYCPELPTLPKIEDPCWKAGWGNLSYIYSVVFKLQNTKHCNSNLVSTTDKRTGVWSRDFMKWKINFGLWAVAWAGLWEKRVWADYEQLLRPVISLFRGQKNFFFWKHHSVRTKKLHKKKVKIFFLKGGRFFFSEKTFF